MKACADQSKKLFLKNALFVFMISFGGGSGGGGGGGHSWIWLMDNIIKEISVLLLKVDYRLNMIVWFHESSGIF